MSSHVTREDEIELGVSMIPDAEEDLCFRVEYGVRIDDLAESVDLKLGQVWIRVSLPEAPGAGDYYQVQVPESSALQGALLYRIEAMVRYQIWDEVLKNQNAADDEEAREHN